MIDDPNFSLDPGPAWHQVANDDAGQYNLRDDARDIDVTLSAIAIAIAPDTIDQLASVLIDSRLHGESDAARAFDRPATIYEPIVVPRPWGRAVAYYGHDESGRQFSFSGIVTPRTVISLYMSSGRLTERELMEAMDAMGSAIVFDRTPMAAGHFD